MDGTFVHLLLLKFSMGSDNFKWKNKAKKSKGPDLTNHLGNLASQWSKIFPK